MSEIITILENEIKLREKDFLSKLSPEMQDEFNAIKHLKQTVEIVLKPINDHLENKQKTLPVKKSGKKKIQIKPVFSLTKEVRKALPELKGSEFGVNNLVEMIQKKFPEESIEKKKRSISGILVGLADDNKIEKVFIGKGGTPSRYKVKESEEKNI